MVMSSEVILGAVAALTLVNVGMLVWIGVLQNRLHSRDDALATAQTGIGELAREAHNVALAKLLLQMEQAADGDVQASFKQLTTRFTQELKKSLARITAQMEGDAQKILTQYREILLTMTRDAATATRGQMDELGKLQQSGFSKDIGEEVARQQMQLMDKFDAKLSDVVSNYLTETLGNDVDLGAQSQYLFRMLEEHKADLRQEIVGGS